MINQPCHTSCHSYQPNPTSTPLWTDDTEALSNLLFMINDHKDTKNIGNTLLQYAKDNGSNIETLLAFIEQALIEAKTSQFDMCRFNDCKAQCLSEHQTTAAELPANDAESTAASEINNENTRSTYKTSNGYFDRETRRFTSSPFSDEGKTFAGKATAELEMQSISLLKLEDLGLGDGKIWQSERVDISEDISLSVDIKADLNAKITPLKISPDGLEVNANAQVTAEAEYINEYYGSEQLGIGSLSLEVQSIAEGKLEAKALVNLDNGRPKVDALVSAEAEAVLFQGVAEVKSEDLMPGPLLFKLGARAEGNLIAAGAKAEYGIATSDSGSLQLTAGAGVSALIGGFIKGSVEIGLDEGKTMDDVLNWASEGVSDLGEKIMDDIEEGANWIYEQFETQEPTVCH